MTTLIVNLYGGPGAGKSTTRAGVFHLLKRAYVNCEECYEVAKEFVWEERHFALSHQPYIFGKMLRNIERLLGKVSVAITDSPIFLSEYYGRLNAPDKYPESFYEFVREMTKGDHGGRAKNLNFFLNRSKPYSTAGRVQTETEAKQIDVSLRSLLDDAQIEYAELLGDEYAKWLIVLAVADELATLGDIATSHAIWDLARKESGLPMG